MLQLEIQTIQTIILRSDDQDYNKMYNNKTYCKENMGRGKCKNHRNYSTTIN